MNQITLLDYFAGQIANGLMSDPNGSFNAEKFFGYAQEMVEESKRWKLPKDCSNCAENNGTTCNIDYRVRRCEEFSLWSPKP